MIEGAGKPIIQKEDKLSWLVSKNKMSQVIKFRKECTGQQQFYDRRENGG